MENSIQTSQFIGAEDLSVGDYVTVADQTYDLVWPICDSTMEPRIARLTACAPDAGRPLKVKSICLPFVLVVRPDAEHITLDVRRHHIVRLAPEYGAKAFKSLRARPTSKKRKKRK